jgi:hypothetical protein
MLNNTRPPFWLAPFASRGGILIVAGIVVFAVLLYFAMNMKR